MAKSWTFNGHIFLDLYNNYNVPTTHANYSSSVKLKVFIFVKYKMCRI